MQAKPVEEKIDGGILRRKAKGQNGHPCVPPDLETHAIGIGDEWECECGALWRARRGDWDIASETYGRVKWAKRNFALSESLKRKHALRREEGTRKPKSTKHVPR